MTDLVPGAGTGPATTSFGAPSPLDEPGAGDYRPIALVDLLDRVLGAGVVVSGELALSIADVDLVYVSLRALLASVRASAAAPPPGPPPAGGQPW
ncbi:gas vesicle protein [Plantactinospora siamensis]|uniref:Gas vesicle protein n=1 Tax=Plantactinospora siamensis TaxID=555372 RepID=A0ABV6NY11_9ACTN